MKLYFGNTVTTITTVMVLALLGFIGYSVWSRASILYWGGAQNCIFVCIRIGYLLFCGNAGRAG